MNLDSQQIKTEILAFEVAGQRYGVLLSDVVEILRAVAVKALPKTPSAVEGVVNMRGRIIPVLDIRIRFGLPLKPAALSDQFIVVRAGDQQAILRVDQATGVLGVHDDMFETTVAAGSAHVKGIAKLPDDLLCVYDLGSFLSEGDAASLNEAAKEEMRP